MKGLSWGAALVAGALLQVTGTAWASPELARSRNCMACHSVANKVVGPAYKDIAARYAGQKDAEDKLASKIVHGGRGAWGPVPMPANSQVSEAESHALAKWILGMK
jgi:cytochrome c